MEFIKHIDISFNKQWVALINIQLCQHTIKIHTINSGVDKVIYYYQINDLVIHFAII